LSIIEKALHRQRGAQAPKSRSGGMADDQGRPASRVPKLPLESERLEAIGLAPPPAMRSVHVHQFRIIKRALLAAAPAESDDLSSLIMVTSAIPGEGKTYVSFNLAQSLALEVDRQVLLVDADVPKRDLTRALGTDHAAGMLDLLMNEGLNPAEVIMPTSIPRLSFLPVGRPSELASELIASDRMMQLCARLSASEGFDTILFDSPPMLLTSESLALTKVVGQVVVVVRATSTPQEMVLDVVEQIDASKRVATILNDWRPVGASEKRRYGGYYYGDSTDGTRRDPAGRGHK
jgi:protein-tyrosine kinase